MAVSPMTSRRLRYIALSGSDEILLRSMLGLLHGHTRDEWQLAQVDEHADLLIVGGIDSQGDAVVAARRRARTCASIVDGREQGDLDLPRPLRPRTLAALLDDASMAIDRPLPSSHPLATATATNGPTLAELIYSLTRHPSSNPEASVISLEGNELMRIDARRSCVHITSASDAIHAAAKHGAKLQTCVGNLAPVDAQPLMPLLWSIGLAHDHALMAPVQSADAIVARRWPDFGRLPHRSEHVRMTARLARQPMTVERLAASIDTSPTIVIGYINAMLLGGLASPAPSSVKPQPLPARASTTPAAPPTRIALLARIRAHLGL